MGLKVTDRLGIAKKRKCRHCNYRKKCPPGRTLIIRDLGHTVTAAELDMKFSEFGEVTAAHVVRRKRSNETVVAMGMVIMERAENAEAALNALKEATAWSVTLVHSGTPRTSAAP
ncbi:hypothetical protein R1sor_025160 [Riccia sorocarpa]|uniref:RRM domain-containing protein n=1 Tax=Riccia sorocarpa TaxID=122646 RepID=A0ABD3G7S6_9MARC